MGFYLITVQFHTFKSTLRIAFVPEHAQGRLRTSAADAGILRAWDNIFVWLTPSTRDSWCKGRPGPKSPERDFLHPRKIVGKGADARPGMDFRAMKTPPGSEELGVSRKSEQYDSQGHCCGHDHGPALSGR